jgi:hypothetical protein
MPASRSGWLVIGTTLLAGALPFVRAGEGPSKGDPAASKLLAEARAARATWEKFPGFTANIEVNLDGQVSRGRARVDASGRVTLQGLDKPAQEWARSTLSSVVGHRLDGDSGQKTACVFGEGGADHPLGREVRVLGDDFHSSYRIRDRQIRVVNRDAKGQKFTITVLHNLPNPKGNYLPASYVVDYWDTKTGALRKSTAFHQSWLRAGGFDLPRTTLAVTAIGRGEGTTSGPAYSVRSLTLSKYKLLRSTAR